MKNDPIDRTTPTYVLKRKILRRAFDENRGSQMVRRLAAMDRSIGKPVPWPHLAALKLARLDREPQCIRALNLCERQLMKDWLRAHPGKRISDYNETIKRPRDRLEPPSWTTLGTELPDKESPEPDPDLNPSGSSEDHISSPAPAPR